MIDPGFPPSTIQLWEVPLVGTLGRAELEHAAAVIIRCYQIKESWEPVTSQEFDDFIKNPGKFLVPWILNPFFRPRFRDLVTVELAISVLDGYDLLVPTVLKIHAKWGI